MLNYKLLMLQPSLYGEFTELLGFKPMMVINSIIPISLCIPCFIHATSTRVFKGRISINERRFSVYSYWSALMGDEYVMYTLLLSTDGAGAVSAAQLSLSLGFC